MKDKKTGTLYVVATPIGNLLDMTLRAIETLKNVDKIAAEDTRHAAPLLKHFSIQKPMLSLHEFNERDKIHVLLETLRKGESIALISDAGTPLISDPGFALVRAAKEANFAVVPVPGASALIAALSVSGLPTDKFVFEGFLPTKTIAKENYLQTLSNESRTMIFYEAPHRLLSSLQSLAKVFGVQRRSTIARELTKIYESVMTAPLENLIANLVENPSQIRGEIVILVEGQKAISEQSIVHGEAVLRALLAELPLKQAVSLAATITGLRKNNLYEMALKIGEKPSDSR